MSSFSDWVIVPSDIAQDIVNPSPLGTLVASAVIVAALAVPVSILWPRPDISGKRSILRRFVYWLDSVDRYFIWCATYVFGTHYQNPALRRALVLGTLGVMAIASAFLRWPLFLVPTSIGLLGIFVTFRHWSHIEGDKTFYNSKPKHPIDIGESTNLNVEVAIACCFILIFAPVVFAQLQVADPHSFSLKGHPSAFAFEGFMLVEVLKIAPIVQYYDVYADILNFERLGTVTDPSFQAKFAVIAFRVSADLVVLGGLKGFLDIARRVSAGLDLTPWIATLTNADEETRIKSVQKLGSFARDRVPLSIDSLKEILNGEYTEDVDVRFEAAKQLTRVAKDLNRKEGRRLAEDIIAAYSRLPNTGNEKLARYREQKGDTYYALARLQNGRVKETIKNALKEFRAAGRSYLERKNRQGARRVEGKIRRATHLLRRSDRAVLETNAEAESNSTD
jgi:hypothetical protein